MVHFPVKGALLQNDIWLSADHQTLLVMEQNRDWGGPNQNRQKNALVGHDRSRWLRKAGGLCVAVYRTSSAVKCPRSQVLAKQNSCETGFVILRWWYCIVLVLLWSYTLFDSLVCRNAQQTWWKCSLYLRVRVSAVKLNSHFIGYKEQEDFCPWSSLLLKVTAVFYRLDVAPWSWDVNSCPCTQICTCDTGMREGLSTSVLSYSAIHSVLRPLGVNWLFQCISKRSRKD